MSENQDGASCDLIRWSFTIDPARKADVEAYLTDLGLDASFQADGFVSVLWEEPEGNAEEIIEGLWEAHGSEFEVTHEEFARLNLLSYSPAEDDLASEAEAA